MGFIYRPAGRAKEYSEWAINIAVGCEHGCQYCYAPGCYKMSKESFFGGGAVKPGILDSIDRELAAVKKKIRPGERVLFCFTSDPYQSDRVARTTRTLLERFAEFDVPFQVLTKAGTRASKDFDLYRETDAFGMTLTFSDEVKSLAVEPKADVPEGRVNALKKAKGFGISTWVSFEPVLSESSVVELYHRTKDFVDLFKLGKVSRFPSDVKDWKAFGNRMVGLFEADGKSYYVKDDLRKLL